jgi:hypothetical protein
VIAVKFRVVEQLLHSNQITLDGVTGLDQHHAVLDAYPVRLFLNSRSIFDASFQERDLHHSPMESAAHVVDPSVQFFCPEHAPPGVAIPSLP